MAEHIFHNPALSIVVLSLAVNFLVLPMYKRADVMQAEERDKEQALDKWTKHIKATFKGDERFMMLQTYYRQENYKQLYVLKSSIPLLLQVPFFMAAYNFLSNLEYLVGVKLGPIADLAEPDALIKMGSVSINLLPILMTAINIVSGAIYSKGFPIKTKVQMYGIALVFLALLYGSPSGLVFYWTLNNVFSLCKNIVVAIWNKIPKKTKAVKEKKDITDKFDTMLFIFSSVCLAFYIGLAMPIEAISRCPQEYIIITHYVDPMNMIISTAATAVGVFVVWFGVFYFLAQRRTKAIYSLVISAFLAVSVFNSLAVSYTGLSMNTEFAFTKPFHWSTFDKVLNIVLVVLIITAIYFIWKFKRNILVYVIVTVLIAAAAMSVRNTAIIEREVSDEYFTTDHYVVPADLTLSRQGQNVIVFMMDRAMGTYYPYIMDNDADLANSFSGFTYYQNVVSYGQNTIFGAPALYGGPEYACAEFNRRKNDSMKDMFDESLLVMPVLFKNNGFDVVVTDPTYAGYRWIPDLSIYDDYGIDAYVTKGAFSETYEDYVAKCETAEYKQQRNLFCYCMTRCMPTFSVDYFYDSGDYYAVEYGNKPLNYVDGFAREFIDTYSTLNNLSAMTTIVDDASNNAIIMSNETTHCVGRQFNVDLSDRRVTDSNGNELYFSDVVQMGAYETNILAYEALADWFDYLKANGVYDNTRIIIVSDHGYYLNQIPELISTDKVDLMGISPLLIVKDFDSEESTVDTRFMTNAAVPYFATQGIIDNPANPFTNTPFSLDYLNEAPEILISTHIMPHTNPGNHYASGSWYRLEGDSFENFELVKIKTP